jgi:hypothetical protein
LFRTLSPSLHYRLFLSYSSYLSVGSSFLSPFLSASPNKLSQRHWQRRPSNNETSCIIFLRNMQHISWNLCDGKQATDGGVKPKIDQCLKWSLNSEITNGITFHRNPCVIIFLRGIICYLIIIQSWIILSQSVVSTRVTSIVSHVGIQKQPETNRCLFSSFRVSGHLSRRQAVPSRSFP